MATRCWWRLTRKRDDERAEGRILRVLTRANPTVVGTFHYGSRNNYVTPIDEKVTQEIVIPLAWNGRRIPIDVAPAAPHVRRERVDAHPQKIAARKRRQDPDRVLGDEVKRRNWDDLEGLVVDVEITDWPALRPESSRARRRDSRLRRRLRRRCRDRHPQAPPAASLSSRGTAGSAAVSSRPFLRSELRHRRDYRNLPIVTIDGETARDFDDAVTVQQLPNGNFELQVHIADVAHYVHEGSAIDLEARLRGTSVYFPDRAMPMLPMELSTDLCSLRPQVDRLVLSCVMEIDHQGEIVGYTLNEGVIRSAERMTYTNVQPHPGGRSRRCVSTITRWSMCFELMRELAMILNRKRVRRGSIDFDLPEPVIEFDENGLDEGRDALRA